MKLQIELTINTEGEPMLSFKHYTKNNELEQKLLGVFIKKAMNKGLLIGSPSGYIDVDNPESCYDNYIIETRP